MSEAIKMLSENLKGQVGVWKFCADLPNQLMGNENRLNPK